MSYSFCLVHFQFDILSMNIFFLDLSQNEFESKLSGLIASTNFAENIII